MDLTLIVQDKSKRGNPKVVQIFKLFRSCSCQRHYLSAISLPNLHKHQVCSDVEWNDIRENYNWHSHANIKSGVEKRPYFRTSSSQSTRRMVLNPKARLSTTIVLWSTPVIEDISHIIQYCDTMYVICQEWLKPKAFTRISARMGDLPSTWFLVHPTHLLSSQS